MNGSPLRQAFCAPNFAAPPLLLLLSGLLLSGLLCPAASAQGPGQLDREIGFVRALAREMQLVSLAQGEVQRLEREFNSAGDQDRVAQLRVEISLYAARLGSDRAQQRTAYKEALDESQRLMESSSDPVVQRDARATLAEAAQEFGQFLIEELEIAREEDPGRVEEFEKEAGDVFRLGIEACNQVMKDLRPEKDKGPQQLLDYCLAWRRKGALLRENARAVKQDRGHLIDSAVDELTEMVIEIGEETALGLRGLFEIALCHEVVGKLDQAIRGYQTTIGQILFTLNNEEVELPAETGALLFNMMQEVYAYLGDLLFERGETEQAAKLFADFRANLQKFGEKSDDLLEVAHPRFGHLAFLAECRLLSDSGDAKKVQQALTTAQAINQKHPNDIVGVRAKAVLRDILSAHESLVSGTLLFEVAKGSFQNGDHEAAIQGFRRAVAAMSPVEAAELALPAHDYMGRAYGSTDRWLEAAFALRLGLERHAKKRDGTEHGDAASVADRLDRVVGHLKSLSKNDPALASVFQQCEPLILEYSEAGVGKIHWKKAGESFRDKKYVEAAASFAQVPEDYLYYELARAREAYAFQAAGDFDKARERIATYREWLQGDESKLDPKRTDKQQVRQMAVELTDWVEAEMAYAEAHGLQGRQKDASRYADALEKMRTFIANHGKGTDSSENLVNAIDAMGRMHAELGELDKAAAAYVQIKDKDERRASMLATVIFTAYLAHAKNQAAELDAAISGGKDEAAQNKLRADLRDTQSRMGGLGIDYMRSSPEPQLGILMSTMEAFEHLDDWKKVDEVAKRALEVWGESTDAGTRASIDQVVRPKVGQALIEQGRFGEALTMLEAAEKANPQLYEVKRLICRALGGWFYIDRAGRGRREPALGKPKEAFDKYMLEYQPWALQQHPKYTLGWYRFQWEAYWWAKMAGETGESDTKYRGYAESLFKTTISLDQGAGLKRLGAAGKDLFTNFNLNRP